MLMFASMKECARAACMVLPALCLALPPSSPCALLLLLLLLLLVVVVVVLLLLALVLALVLVLVLVLVAAVVVLVVVVLVVVVCGMLFFVRHTQVIDELAPGPDEIVLPKTSSSVFNRCGRGARADA
jgi:hypothetical protein